MQLKIASILAVLAVGAGLLVAAPAQAAVSVPIQIIVDGRPLALDAAPLNEDGRTLVPVRALFEALGAQVNWEAVEQRVTGKRSDHTVVLWVGSQTATVDGATVGLDVAPRIVDGRTLVPVRFVGESLGARVGYDAASATVVVDSRGGGPGVGRGEARPLGEQIAATARSFVGAPYVWGGAAPGGFDCSGLAFYTLGRFGISLPRTSFDQFQGGAPVSRTGLQPGDLVFFSTYAAGASHVGIYLDNDQFVEAESSTAGVVIKSLDSAYWGSRYVGARRYRP